MQALPEDLLFHILAYANEIYTRIVCQDWNHIISTGIFNENKVHKPLTPLPIILSNFGEFCKQGRLEYAQFLHQIYTIPPEEIKTEDNWAFCCTCLNGYLKVAKWLHDICRADGNPITPEEAKTRERRAARIRAIRR